MNVTVSPCCTCVCSIPVSSQSVSFTNTRMPGRLHPADSHSTQPVCSVHPCSGIGVSYVRMHDFVARAATHTLSPFMKSSGRSVRMWSLDHRMTSARVTCCRQPPGCLLLLPAAERTRLAAGCSPASPAAHLPRRRPYAPLHCRTGAPGLLCRQEGQGVRRGPRWA